ncbi:hypothetical protein U1Q18_011548 [Sarracenia purpurea var. burkii]
MIVGKLIDGYLLETASDAYLKPKKFYQLAVALPDYAGIFDHGLYRSVDVYHKVWLPSDRCQADLATTRGTGVFLPWKATKEEAISVAQKGEIRIVACYQVKLQAWQQNSEENVRRKAIRQHLWKRRWFGLWIFSGEICRVLRSDQSKCDSEAKKVGAMLPIFLDKKELVLCLGCDPAHHNRKNM